MAKANAEDGSFLDRIKSPFIAVGQFLKDVQSELQRVVWPSHEETYSFTVVVVIAMVIVGVWVGVLDFLFTKLMGWLGIAG